MADKEIDLTPEVVEIHGKKINLTAIRRGKKGGKPMNKSDFEKSFPVKLIPTGKVDKETGKPLFKEKKHPKLDDIWSEIQKLTK